MGCSVCEEGILWSISVAEDFPTEIQTAFSRNWEFLGGLQILENM